MLFGWSWAPLGAASAWHQPCYGRPHHTMPILRVRRSLKILIVDDDEVDRKSIQRALKKSTREYEMIEAVSMAGALEAAQDASIDCVLLDNRLPDGTALEFLERSQAAGIELPVVVLTGQGHEELAVELIKAGAADYLTKSSHAERIEAAVRGAVRWFRTEQKAKAAEAALHASRESLATTLRSVADAVITTDQIGQVTYLNPAAARYCRYTHDECVGKPLWEVLRVQEELRPAQRERMSSALRRGLRGKPLELRLLTGEGELVVVQERVGLLMSADRQTPSGLVLTLTDVTDRQRNEERLEFLLSVGNELARGHSLSVVLQRAVALTVPKIARSCAIGIAPDADGWSWSCAPGEGALAQVAAQLFGAAGEGGEAMSAWIKRGQMLVMPPGNTSPVLPDLDLSALGYTAWFPIVARYSLGLLVLESETAWQRDELSLVRDFVQRVGLALDNALLVQRLEESVRIRDDMLAVVSHDLRSPLNAMSLATDNLVEECGGDVAEEYGEVVQRAIARMNRLIQDLLDAETMASGRFSLALEVCALGEVVADVEQLHGPLAEAKGLQFQLELPASLPPVHADRHRLTQVLSNLIGNAIKFTDSGLVKLRVEPRSDGVLLEVSDTGPGISPEQRAHLFERFWRADRKAAGSGLGLTIVQGILAAHSSQIHVDSNLGEGTRFSFRLMRAAEA